jgi:hypothetical protein
MKIMSKNASVERRPWFTTRSAPTPESGEEDARNVRTCFGIQHDKGYAVGSPTPQLLD